MSLLCGLATDETKNWCGWMEVDERVLRTRAICFFVCPLNQSWIFYDFDFPRLLCVASTSHSWETHKKLVKLFNLFLLGLINIWTQTNNRMAAKTPSVICWSAKMELKLFAWFLCVCCCVGFQVFSGFCHLH